MARAKQQVVYVERAGGISSGAAAILSLLLPGLGQLCQGRPIMAMFSFAMVFFLHLLFFWLFFIPGIVMHIIVVVDAARWKPRRRQR